MLRLGGHRRRLPIALALVLVLAAGVVAALLLGGGPGNVNDTDVAFDTQGPSATQTGSRPGVWSDDGFRWPMYGLTPQRTKYLPLNRDLRPPFVERWRMTGSILLEFTPVLCGRSLYLLKNNGALYSISRSTGRVRWKRKLGYLAAASPACDGRSVYSVLLERAKGAGAGRIVSVSTGDGRTRWSRRLPSRSESSPLLISGRLYFGSEDGTVYAMRARDGGIVWTHRAGGAVKGGLAYDRGRLYFGDYAGAVTAIERRDGRQVWRTGTRGGAFGLRSGTFYGTPAAAYGRLYLGNTDGFVYSFDLERGRLAWRHKTGGYVYSSPAISPVAGGTVFVGSYDQHIYALDARSGSVRWRHATGGRIVGGPAVIGNLVFYSNLGKRSTAALGVNTGRLLWSVGRGAFNPVISDGTRLYLNGYSSLYMYTERGRHSDGSLTPGAKRARTRRARARAAARHRRYVDRRVARRRARVHRSNARRSAGIRVCFERGGKVHCRLPRKLTCFKRDGRVVCRPVARER